MTSPQLHHPTRTSRHGIHTPQLTLQPRIQIPLVALTPYQRRHQQTQRMPRHHVTGIRGPAHRTQRLNAVIDGAHARAQPDRIRGRRGELRIEDDELRAADWVLEGVLAAGVRVRGVVCAAGEVGVFACRERGWDGDYRDRGVLDVGGFVGALG